MDGRGVSFAHVTLRSTRVTTNQTGKHLYGRLRMKAFVSARDVAFPWLIGFARSGDVTSTVVYLIPTSCTPTGFKLTQYFTSKRNKPSEAI